MKLYSYWRSSSAWRVRIAVAYKRIDCAIVTVHLVRGGGQQNQPDFLARNPLAQVPVLELERDGAPWVLTQSMAILEYFEECHPTPPLLPRDPRLRARARQLAEVVNSGTQPLQNLRLQETLKAKGVDPGPLVQHFIRTGLESLETIARPTAGRFLVGDELSIADLYLVPQLYSARRFGVDVSAFPLLTRIEETCVAIPAFAAAHPDAQPDREPPPP